MVLLIIIPIKNGYFFGNTPNIFRQTHFLTIQYTHQTATNINKHHQRTSVCSGHLHQDKCIQSVFYISYESLCVCALLRPRIRSFFLILSSSGIFRGHVQSWKICFFLFLIAGVSSFGNIQSLFREKSRYKSLFGVWF